MDYRIYVDGTGGYYNLGTYNKDETLICLDWLILEEQTKQKILAIECNYEDNIEFPVFLYLGKQADYDDFKNYLNNEDEEVRVTKCYRKKL